MVDEQQRIPAAGRSPSLPGPVAEGHAAAGSKFSRRILEIGFVTALILALACLASSAYYLISFERSANAAVTGVLAASRTNPSPNELYVMQFSLSVHMYIARILLLSCGIFAGLSFGFLGFSLFLMGVDGAISAEAQGQGALRVSVTSLAPGAFVILCAAILIGICATASLPARVSSEGVVTTSGGNVAAGENAVAPPGAADATESVDLRPPEEAGTK